MKRRRQFLKNMAEFLVGVGIFLSPAAFWVRQAFAKIKKIILPKGTRPETLQNRNPAALDTRNLELTPIEKFGTMGTTDHQVDLKTWQLEVSGHLQRPLQLSYQQIRQLPAIERNVLLICPGVFSYNAHWKGVSVATLLEMAQVRDGATHVSFSGPVGNYEKMERFPIADILSNKVFLAYRVNGEDLPEKHGFPLRVVAEGYYGSDWVKYVYKVAVIG
ncbi:MAG: molybdopterin-dependent oxidoreductase [Desulfobacterales bacterium]|jgi:DMSO/TMAO reductase YedYZ molybdopterin-dependent catalytic subunit